MTSKLKEVITKKVLNVKTKGVAIDQPASSTNVSASKLTKKVD